MVPSKEKGKAPLRRNAERASEDGQLPSVADARDAFRAGLVPELESVRVRLSALAEMPPQLLHLEGGTADERVALALWWAALLNCEAHKSEPCLVCPACLRIGAGMHADSIFLDGRKAGIRIAEVRALRPLLGEKPRYGRRRVIMLAESQALGLEAANSLLKILEDPCQDTCFVFTVPQRERLLPTLVSRGWVMTLPWKVAPGLPEELVPWEDALVQFLREGRGWFDRTAERNALDASLVQRILPMLERALADRLAGREGALANTLRGLSERELLQLDEELGQSWEALQAQVNPTLVLDTLLAGVYAIIHAHRRP